MSVRFASSFSKLLSLRAYKSLIVCVGFTASFDQLPSPRAFKSLGFSYPLPVSAGVHLPDFSASCLCGSPWFLSYLFLQAYKILVFWRKVRTILWVCRCLSLFGYNSVLSLIVSVCVQGRIFSYRLFVLTSRWFLASCFCLRRNFVIWTVSPSSLDLLSNSF